MYTLDTYFELKPKSIKYKKVFMSNWDNTNIYIVEIYICVCVCGGCNFKLWSVGFNILNELYKILHAMFIYMFS